MKTSLNLMLIFSCATLLQCSPANKVKETSTPDFERLVKKLQKNPADDKSIAILGKEYKKLQQEHLLKIHSLEKISSVTNNELIFSEYKNLQDLYQSIKTIPGLINKIKPVNYTYTIDTLKNNLINQLTIETDHLLEQGKKESCRKAYYDLLKLKAYQPNYASLPDKISRSLQCASIYIAIDEPIIDNRYSHFNAEIGNFYKDLINNLKSDASVPFIKIESLSTGIDESLRFRFTQFDIGVITKDNHTREVTNNQPYSSGGRRTTATPGNAPSSATITTTRIASLSSADLQLEIFNTSGMVIYKQEFNARHEWNNEVNTYSGDRRALSSNDRSQLRNPVKNPPTESEIVNELLKQLSEKIISCLQDRYAGL